jgi:hypothetical protein
MMRSLAILQVSFHKYGEFFPGTGALADIGYGKGAFPLLQECLCSEYRGRSSFKQGQAFRFLLWDWQRMKTLDALISMNAKTLTV